MIFSNNGTLAGRVTVEDHVILGGLTAVHQFCRLGRHAITGGCSKIVQDVPPFMLADGNPARIRDIDKVGMERHGFVTRSARDHQVSAGFPAAWFCRMTVLSGLPSLSFLYSRG